MIYRWKFTKFNLNCSEYYHQKNFMPLSNERKMCCNLWHFRKCILCYFSQL